MVQPPPKDCKTQFFLDKSQSEATYRMEGTVLAILAAARRST
jgi:hypothetical protein